MSVFIIAEAGVNHNGDIKKAMELVEVAAQAGADAVKFQTFKAESLVAKDAPKASYQVRNTGVDDGQYAMLKALELSADDHRVLLSHCQKLRIGFLSSPFDRQSLDFLADDLGLGVIKLGSGEITNAPLLLAAGRKARHVILSTGMSTLVEIEDALGVLAFAATTPSDAQPGASSFRAAYASKEGKLALNNKVTLLHCTTDYPAIPEDANLKAIPAMAERFKLRVGFSDHTPGIVISLGAVALGATVIEKHLTLDRTLPGPDHMASLEPGDFKSLVDGVRLLEGALGDGVKRCMASEQGNRLVARKSLAAIKTIAKGDAYTKDNIGALRPGDGISPMAYWEMLGTSAAADLNPGDRIQ